MARKAIRTAGLQGGRLASFHELRRLRASSWEAAIRRSTPVNRSATLLTPTAMLALLSVASWPPTAIRAAASKARAVAKARIQPTGLPERSHTNGFTMKLRDGAAAPPPASAAAVAA